MLISNFRMISDYCSTLTGRHFFEVDKFDGSGFTHWLHRVNDVVLERVDPVLLVQADRAHGLLAHGTLIRVARTLKLRKSYCFCNFFVFLTPPALPRVQLGWFRVCPFTP